MVIHELEHDYLCDSSMPVLFLERQNGAERPELLLVFGAILHGVFDPSIPLTIEMGMALCVTDVSLSH